MKSTEITYLGKFAVPANKIKIKEDKMQSEINGHNHRTAKVVESEVITNPTKTLRPLPNNVEK